MTSYRAVDAGFGVALASAVVASGTDGLGALGASGDGQGDQRHDERGAAS